MKARTAERIAREAMALADALRARLPADADIPVEDIFALAWPLARRLVRLERRIARDAEAAEKARVLREQIAAVLAAEPDTCAPLFAVANCVPFTPGAWRIALVPDSDRAARSEAVS